MADDKHNGEAAFMSWFSKKVSPAQLSELYMVFQEIEQQAKKAKVVKNSLYENTDLAVFKKIRSNIEQSKVFKFTHKRQMGRINSALNYLLRYAQDGASSAEVRMLDDKGNRSFDRSRETSANVITQTEERAGIWTIDLKAIPDMAFTKPVTLSYFGNEMQENSWRTLSTDLCKQLIDAAEEPLRFRTCRGGGQ